MKAEISVSPAISLDGNLNSFPNPLAIAHTAIDLEENTLKLNKYPVKNFPPSLGYGKSRLVLNSIEQVLKAV